MSRLVYFGDEWVDVGGGVALPADVFVQVDEPVDPPADATWVDLVEGRPVFKRAVDEWQPLAVVAGTPATASFDFTGAPETWVVPAGVTQVTVVAAGASTGTPGTANEAKGGRTTATIGVVPGETLTVRVGGSPGESTVGGFNGGGNGAGAASSLATGGGGATDLRREDTLAGRLVVAGGGGGRSGHAMRIGGAGGGLIGGRAENLSFYPGHGGTQSAGGAPGGGDGTAGALGQGGNGRTENRTGGGGGGGYYGGGGGGGDWNFEGVGGGGSSFAIPQATNVTHEQGVHSGTHGSLILNYLLSPG